MTLRDSERIGGFGGRVIKEMRNDSVFDFGNWISDGGRDLRWLGKGMSGNFDRE